MEYSRPTTSNKPRLLANILRLLGATLLFSLVATRSTGTELAYASPQFQSQLPQHRLTDFQPITRTTGWILLDQQLFWTDTTGQDWRDITPPQSNNSAIQAVSFLDARNGWAILTDIAETGELAYSLAQTDDGGANWRITPLSLFQPGEPGAMASAVYLHRLDEQVGWLVVKQATSSNFSLGSLFQTTDAGQSWRQLDLPLGEPVFFASRDIGWVAGGPDRAELYRTTNGGQSWSRQELGQTGQPTTYYLPGFTDPQTGYLPVLISDGEEQTLELYHSRDSGESWQLKESQSLAAPTDFLVEGYSGGLSIFATNHTLHWRIAGAQLSKSADELPATGNLTQIALNAFDSGWASFATGQCSPEDTQVQCTSELELMSLDSAPQKWMTIPLPGQSDGLLRAEFTLENGASASDQLQSQAVGSQTTVFTGQGFDKCEIASLSQLQNWHTNSPYKAVNLYIGGSARACGNSALSQSYLQQLSQQGWKFIPTWVGPQAACTGFSSRMSLDPATAYNQGVAEANAAVAVAKNLGLTLADQSGAIIYYDLEGYNTGDAACRTAAKSFISGWTKRLKELNNQAGVYGSACASAIADFATIANIPDAIWPAAWYQPYAYNSNASVWNVPCLSNGLWSMQQRIRQYTGGHSETWGGVPLTIDSNAIDGIVAQVNSSPPAETPIVVNPPALYPSAPGSGCGNYWYAFNDANYNAWLTLNAATQSQSSNYGVWRPNIPRTATYKIEAYIASHNRIDACGLTYNYDTSNAVYTVHHAGGSQPVAINQQPVWSDWVNLGNFQMTAGTGGYVELTDLTGESFLSRVVSFSAMRFTCVANCSDAPQPDVTNPGGNITSPANGATFKPGDTIHMAADAWDNPDGSGVKRVEFWIDYGEDWVRVKDEYDAPYEANWVIPADLSSRSIEIGIHVVDNAGNVAIDPGGKRTVNFSNPDFDLAERFAPVLRFSSDSCDPFRPIAVDVPIEKASIIMPDGSRKTTTADNLVTDTGNNPDVRIDLKGLHPDKDSDDIYQVYKNEIQPNAEELAYARVYRGDPDKVVIQYWFYYYANPWQQCGGKNYHESDWEMVQVTFDKSNQPLYATFTQHLGGTKRIWDERDMDFADETGYQTQGGTHPVVYVARGSHANYFAPYDYAVGGGPIYTGVDKTSNLGENTKPLKIQLIPISNDENTWLYYKGNWNGEANNLPFPFGNGVNSPSQQDKPFIPKWSDPASWVSSPVVTWDEKASHNISKKFNASTNYPFDLYMTDIGTGEVVGGALVEGGEFGAEHFDNPYTQKRTLILHKYQKDSAPPGYAIKIVRASTDAFSKNSSEPISTTLFIPDYEGNKTITATYYIADTWGLSTTAVISVYHGSDLQMMVDYEGNNTVDKVVSPTSISEIPMDDTPPAAVTDLQAHAAGEGRVTLTWTAPGNEGDVGTASAYAIRYATEPITEDNWFFATAVITPPTPSTSGSAEAFTITGLMAETYYFAVKAIDEEFHHSSLSNVTQVVNEQNNVVYLPILLK